MRLTTEECQQIAEDVLNTTEDFNTLPVQVQTLMKAAFVIGMTQMQILVQKEDILDLEIKIKLNEP